MIHLDPKNITLKRKKGVGNLFSEGEILLQSETSGRQPISCTCTRGQLSAKFDYWNYYPGLEKSLSKEELL